MINIEVYTDGSCYSEFSIGGWGVYIIFGNKKIKFSGSCRCKTPIKAELLAILKAVEYLENYLKEEKMINIYTDCDYMLRLLKDFNKKGKLNFRDKTSLQNKQLISTLFAYITDLNIKWHPIKSHKGNKGNGIADKLAKKAALNSLSRTKE